jgi:hypothetical protein
VGYLLLFRSGPNQMQVGGGTPLSYPQDHASRSCSVLFARYFVIVISCVVYFISSLAPDRVSLAELRLCVCHYHVAIFQLPFPGSSLVDILVVENMFLQLLSSLFCEIFFGDFNYYQSREHIHNMACCSNGQRPSTCLTMTALLRPPVPKPSFVSFSLKCNP